MWAVSIESFVKMAHKSHFTLSLSKIVANFSFIYYCTFSTQQKHGVIQLTC